jgi:hypothetical protein
VRFVVAVLRYGSAASLVLWVVGVGGAFGPAVNWTALTVGVGLVGLSRLARTD